MEHLQGIHLRQIQSRLGRIAFQLTNVQFRTAVAHEWAPAVNAYRCERCIVVCVDLAGVDREKTELTVEPRRVQLRGRRGW